MDQQIISRPALDAGLVRDSEARKQLKNYSEGGRLQCQWSVKAAWSSLISLIILVLEMFRGGHDIVIISVLRGLKHALFGQIRQ